MADIIKREIIFEDGDDTYTSYYSPGGRHIIERCNKYKREQDIKNYGEYYSIASSSIDATGTANCQWGVLTSACNMLPWPKKALKVIFKYIQTNITGKRCLLMDLNTGYLKYIDQVFDSRQIIHKSLYTSTNKSQMTLFIIRIDGYDINNVLIEQPEVAATVPAF